MLIVIVGPPGAGKGTQSARLVEHLRVPHLSTGEILRQAAAEKTELGKLATPYLALGSLVPDRLVVDLVGERLGRPDCAAGCLLDGFPRTLGQASALDEYLQRHGRRLDLAIELRIGSDELIRRLLARKRVDDTLETISHRLDVYRRETEPILKYYDERGIVYTVDGVGTPDEVFAHIVAGVEARQRQLA